MPTRKPVTIRGKTYKSIADAARDLGVDYEIMRRHVQRGTTEWVFKGTRRCRGLQVPVTIDGVEYKNRAVAARALGVPYWKLRDK